MHRLIPLRLIAFTLTFTQPLCYAGEVLHIASDDWCPFVCTSGNQISGGYLVDLSTQALALSGYQVTPVLLPLKRAIAETANGRLQGVYAPPIDSRLQLTGALIYSRACFYTLNNETWAYQGIESLGKLTVGIIEDYGYDNAAMDNYIQKNEHNPLRLEIARGENAGLRNLQKLLAKRFPTMLEHEAVMLHLLSESGETHNVRLAGCLEQKLPLTLGFSKADARNDLWVKALHDGYLRLQQSGEADKLRLRYGITSEDLRK